jgi:signal transduction histidine kinase
VELIPQTSLVRATWRALLLPRRLVPILVVSVPLLVAQSTWSDDQLSLPLGTLMVLAFVTLAPVSYRVLFPDGLDFSHGAVRVVLYALIGAGVILSIGAGIPKVLHMRPTFLTDRTSLSVIIALFLVGGWGLGRDIGFEQRVARLQQEAERAQLLALKAHLDPHFLFNTLNAIAEWCRIDGEVAERAVLSLSAMLRVMLEGVRAPSWPLEKELELARQLLALHLLRDKALFTLVERVDPQASALVPPMCLVTLVENAVKHGPAAGHRGELTLEVARVGAQVTIAVENPGPYRGPREGGVGLPMLEQHLRLAFGPRASVTLADVGARTRATLTVPQS